MRNNRGFTLIEMIVVTVILITLMSVAIPQLAKTVESSRAHDAVGVLNAVGSGVRMFRSDWSSSAITPSTALTTTINTTACPAGGKPTSVGGLLGCKYIQPQNWDNLRYAFYVCESGAPTGTCCVNGAGENRVACADRRDTDPESGSATSAAYKDWVYWIDNYGGCHAVTTSQPPCPRV